MADRSNEPEAATAVEQDDVKPAKTGKPLLNQGISTYCTKYTSHSTVQPAQTVPLARYIILAEMSYFKKRLLDSPIFARHHKYYTEPLLRQGRPNRILIYAGCFNPPHMGHLELLAHAFLRTDSNTIAAMIVPVGNVLYGKNDATVDGNKFCLSKEDYGRLFEDKLLKRFSWVFSGRSEDVMNFRAEMVRLARMDGYQLSFVGLIGSDHVSLVKELIMGWGDKGLITSDITRPSVIMTHDSGPPVQLWGCGAWRKILPAKSRDNVSNNHCWPCWKFQAICPELRGGSMPRDTSFLSFFGGISSDIWHCCHEHEGIVWICRRINKQQEPIWFLPSDRPYPEDERRTAISSTLIRNILDQTPKEELYDAMKALTMNPKRLLSILKMVDDMPICKSMGMRCLCGLNKTQDDTIVDMVTMAAHRLFMGRRKSF